jgi:hypothetical protein
MATGNVLTGARARFTLEGTQVGYATGVTVRESITYEPVQTLDNIQVVEHAPTGYECSMTAELVRIIGSTIKSEGWFPKQGVSPEDHLSNILSSGELTATIEADANIGTPQIVMNVEGVRISERNMNVTARGIVGTNVSMVAIRCRDESDA